MLNRILTHFITAFERRFDYDMSYARTLLRARRAAYLRFLSVTWMVGYRANVPTAAWYAAKLAAVIDEDCGPCTQLVVRMASADGVDAAQLRAMLQRDMQALDRDTALGLAFATAVLARAAEATALRERVRERWGEAGLAALALGIAGSRVFPCLKYALGHGRSCGLVSIDGDSAPVYPVRRPTTAADATA